MNARNPPCGGCEDCVEPSERIKRARETGYVCGALDMLFVLALFDLIDTRSPCMRCGEQTDDTVNALGVDFPMCEGCK